MSSPAFSLPPAEAAELKRQIDAGFLLPSRWYADPAIFQAELERIHRRAWHFAAHTGQLKETGDVALASIAGVPIVLTRGKDGAVNGFVNICRHRGHPVVMEAGNRHAIRCHFHGWTYELDGALRHAPRSAGDPTFDGADFGLVRVQTHVWGPTVWVNIDLGAPSFDDWIAGMPQVLAERGLDLADHSYAFGHTWRIEANWKVFQDNTIECYHCPTTHPELCQALEMKPELQEFWVGGPNWIHHRIPFREGLTEGLTFKKPEGGPLLYFYHWIFPGTYLQYSGKGFDIGSLNIIAPDRIDFTHICFLPHDTPDKVRAKGQRLIETDATIWQDVGLCNRVQAGHASGMAPQSRVFPQPEFLLSHFHRRIVDLMTDPPRAAAQVPHLRTVR